MKRRSWLVAPLSQRRVREFPRRPRVDARHSANCVGVVVPFFGVGLVLLVSARVSAAQFPGGLLIASGQVTPERYGCVAVKRNFHYGELVPMLSGNRPHAGIWPSPSVRPPYRTSP